GGTVLNGADLQDLGAGLYELTLTDALGCSTTASIVLSEPDTLAVSFTVSDIGGFGTSCTANDGSISTSITGGSPGYVVQWTGPNGFISNLTNLTDLVAGTYIATATDANGCTAQGVVTLDAAPPVFMELDPAPGACAGDGLGSISSTVTGGIAPFQYAWTGPDGFTSNAPELIDVVDGTYVLTVTDTLGCTATTSTTLSGPAPLQSTLVPSFYGLYNIRCAGDSSGTLSVDVTGGTASYTMTVTGPTGTLSGNGPFTQLIAGTYTIGITDANGCSADTSITLTAPDSPIISALTADIQPSGTNISCQGGSDGSIDASITGGSAPYTFAWSGPGGFSAGTEDITGLSAGNAPYVLQVTDSNQCVHSAAITLTEPSSPLIGIGSTSNYGSYAISCSGASDGSIDLFVSGGSPGYTIVWNGPGVDGVQTEDLTGIAAGTYTATITDINGCTATVSFNLDQPEPLVVGINTFTYPGGSPISCTGANDAEVTATWTGGSAPYSATWTGPDGITFDTPSITDLGPGTYCVQLIDGQGCTADTCITITEPSPLAITSTSTPADCGTATGTIDLSTSGGSAPYAYAWSTGGTTQDLSGLSAGSYDVTVVDANGCSAQLTTTVTGTPAVQVEGSTTAALCSDALSGSVNITTTSGTAPFQYSWSNGATSEDLAAVGAGSYAVTVLDG
ncbi:MAG TPA: SprB repeat-containing protein, partial [Flavobacteriales bacterium]|nr:SprB repeat-containing protein [Flavobacteriales bacterium]